MVALHSTLLGCIARPTGVVVAALACATVPDRAEAQEVNACYVRTVGAVYLVGLPNTPSTCLDASHMSVPLGRLADGSVTAVKLADGAVITIKLADGAVTIAKLSFDPATQTELDALRAPGTINDPNNPVHWTKLTGVPTGFADGTDNVGGAGGIDTITAGAGLTATPSNPITTRGTLSVNFAGLGSASSVARSDHTHAAPVESDPTWIGPTDSTSTVSRLGSVSIGTTSGTNYKLQIVTGSLDGGLRIQNNNSNLAALRITNDPGAGRPLFVDNASTEGIHLSTTGNTTSAVGIVNSGTGHALRIDNSGGGRGLYVVNSGGGLAGYFGGSSADVAVVGNLDVGGTLTKGGGAFQIDHPLDPENRILRHSFVESPDMMNVYNGIVTTDSLGAALVELPTYFEALNRDFRYQLTVIGQFAQAIVADEIRNNRFAIRTNQPHVKVSWQVTGIRKDQWAEAHRIVVEEDKRRPR